MRPSTSNRRVAVRRPVPWQQKASLETRPACTFSDMRCHRCVTSLLGSLRGEKAGVVFMRTLVAMRCRILMWHGDRIDMME